MSSSGFDVKELSQFEDEAKDFRKALKSLGFSITLPLGRAEGGKEVSGLPASWNLFLFKNPLLRMLPPTVTFITSSSLTNKGHKAEHSVPEALTLLSGLRQRAIIVLESAGISSEGAAKLVILSMAWQGPVGGTAVVLGGRGKYPLADQVEYVRRGYSYDDVYLKEKYKMTFDEWEESKDLPRSYLAAMFGEQ